MLKKITETVYVTKYALTAGIETFHGGRVDGDGSYFYTATGYQYFKFGTDAFYSCDEAERNAREKAARKLASLDKQRAKILPLLNKPKWATAD